MVIFLVITLIKTDSVSYLYLCKYLSTFRELVDMSYRSAICDINKVLIILTLGFSFMLTVDEM